MRRKKGSVWKKIHVLNRVDSSWSFRRWNAGEVEEIFYSYHDVTGEAKSEYFWFPLGSSHDWNCPAFVQDILQCNMQRCIAAGGRKITQPTSVGWLHERDVVFTRGQNNVTVPCPTPSHPSLSLSTSSASSVLKQKIRIGFAGNHQNIPIFCLLIGSSLSSSCVLSLQNYPCLCLMQRLFCKAERLTPSVPSLTPYLLQFIPFQS